MTPQPVAQVSALASGELLLNGQPVDLHDLDAALKELKNVQGIVWYYRESSSHEPPPQAMDAMGLVIKHQLPLCMSTEPDFSDVVDADGNPVSR